MRQRIKSLLILVLIMIVSIISVNTAKTFAITEDKSLLIAPSGDVALGQEKHTYNVNFKNDGEAFVKARLVISNDKAIDRDTINLDFGGIVLQDPLFYQQILTSRCYPDIINSCSNLSAPDYYTEYFGEYETKYELLTYTKEGNQYKIKLKNNIKTANAGAIIMSFRTKDYTKMIKPNLYEINYATPKYETTIDKVTVNIAASFNKYYFHFTGLDINKLYGTASVSKEAISNGQDNSALALDNFSNSIYANTMASSEGANVLSGESLVVKGEYAKSIFLLYRHNVLMLILFSLVIILFAVISTIIFIHKVKTKPDYKPIKDINFYVQAVIIGFIALLKFSGGMAIFYLMSSNIFQAINPNYYFDSDYSGWIILFRLIMIFLLIILNISTVLFMSYIFKAKTRFMPLMALLSQLLYAPVVLVFVFLFLMQGV